MNTRIICSCLAILLISILFGCEKWEYNRRAFIDTGQQIQLTTKSATYRGELTNLEAVSVQYVGHCWSSDGNLPTIENDTTQFVINSSEGFFTSILKPLNSNEGFIVRGYAISTNGNIYYGAPKSFVTASIIITTESVINMKSNQVEVVGRITGQGLTASDVLDSIGHTWTTDLNSDPEVNIDSFTLLSKGTEGRFESQLNSLENGVDYRVRSYAIENGKILYGNSITFKIVNVWEEKKNLALGKYGGVSFVINEKAFVGLGRINENFPTKTFFAFDAETNHWEKIADFPGEARFGSVAFVIENKAYVGLGTNDNENDDTIGEYFRDFWVFDYETMAWGETPLASGFPGDGVAYASAFSINGVGYVGLGSYVSDTDGYIYTTRVFYSYNSNTEEWEINNDLLYLPGDNWKSQALCFVDEEKNIAYLGGGRNSNLKPQNDIWQFTPGLGWDSLSMLLPGSPRANGISFVIGRNAYIGTGTGNFFPNARKDFWKFNLDTKKWTRKANLTGTVRIGAVGFNINNKGYIATGSGCAFGFCTISFKDIWEYFPDG